MKNTISIALLFGLLFAMTASCEKSCESKRGAFGIDTIALEPGLSKLKIEGQLRTRIHQDNRAMIVVSGGNQLRENVSIDDSDSDTIKIFDLNGCRFLHGYENIITLDIYLPTITHLVNRCAQPISFETPIVTDSLTLTTAGGGGNVTLKSVDCNQKLRVTATKGAGNLAVGGIAGFIEVYASDIASIDVSNVRTSYAHAIHEGYGNVSVFSSGIAKAENFRSGTIQIFGSPDSTDISNLGSGEVTVE